jgi:hypothetical protein
MDEELARHDRADAVATRILRATSAAAVPMEAGHRVGSARLQRSAEDVPFACHGPSLSSGD